MLIINVDERISWENYFKHPFFNINEDKINKLKLPEFNFQCKKHLKELIGYCPNCKCNLCLICYNQHFSKFHHHVLFFLKLVFLKKKLKKLMMSAKILKTK